MPSCGERMLLGKGIGSAGVLQNLNWNESCEGIRTSTHMTTRGSGCFAVSSSEACY